MTWALLHDADLGHYVFNLLDMANTGSLLIAGPTN
jgi:hypothetical protein